MSIKNVDTMLIKNNLKSCLDYINFNDINEIITKNSNDNIWKTSTRDKYNEALKILVNVKYKELSNLLIKYLDITNKIDEYQKLAITPEQEIEYMIKIQNEISN